MRKTIAIASIAILLSGCYGSFQLTKNVYDMNGRVSDNGFVKSVVMVGMFIIPIYEIAGLADILIFNSLEFWTGENPISMKEGERRRQLIHANGTQYQVDAIRDRSEIVDMNDSDGAVHALVFDRESGSWAIED